MEIRGYRRVTWKLLLFCILCVLTLGLLLLFIHWKPRLYVLLTCRHCPLAEAQWLVIKDAFGQISISEVRTEQGVDVSLGHHVIGRLGKNGVGSVIVGVEDQEEFKDTIQLHHKDENNELRYFVFEGMRYIWSNWTQNFVKVSSLDEGVTCGELHKKKLGLNQTEHNGRKQIYGANEIDVPVKSYGRLLIEEVLNPFYIFQVFSIVLWMCDNYYYYSGCILVISVISIGLSLYETRKQSVTLRNMVKMQVSVRVRRETGEEMLVNSPDLVPGDCIILPPEGILMPCDAALLSGECMVNESMLTGESVPEMKTPLTDGPQAGGTPYCPEEHKRHTLFGGTQIIQAKTYLDKEVIAVVTRTGFCTVKGNLISSILHPKPVSFKFYRDAAKFVLVLGLFAFLGNIYSIGILIKNKVSVRRIIIQTLDLITIIVPPALPAAMTVGTIYAQSRLKKQGIFCISPPRINVCGKIKLFCFDKTGTLTEEGLDVWGVVPLDNTNFLPITHDPRCLPDGPILQSLVSCHSVTLLKGNLIGDIMDVKMMESTNWTLDSQDMDEQMTEHFGTKVLAVMKPPPLDEQPHGPKHHVPIGVLRRFPFSSALQRMSVISKLPGDSPALLYMKGAPEMVASLCKSDTVPLDFSAMLKQYTKDGYRVLGFGYKTLDSVKTFEDAQLVTRESVEQDLSFLGFLIMKNVLKPETSPVIHELRRANIRTVMVTGDNMLTAVNVARSCHIVEATERVFFASASPPSLNKAASVKFIPAEAATPEETQETLYQQGGSFLDKGPYCFAMNGKSFSALCDHFPQLLPKILIRSAIFARMSPDQKTQLVQNLQELNYCVGMCGDGANDCGALKAADVGVSLSDAEASVASPFTSRTSNIECVPALIREGRCSLETSFGMFKYMALYSLTQFITALILYTVNTNLGDLQFLYFDLVITTLVAILMGRTGPANELGIKRPLGTLISLPVLGSLIFQTILILIIQLIPLFLVQNQSWFVPVNVTNPETVHLPNDENTVLFCISGFQYLILAVVLSKGHPFRKPIYTNVPFLLLLLALLALCLWITIAPLGFMKSLLQLVTYTDINFQGVLVGLVTVNFIAAFLVEMSLDYGFLNCLKRLRRKKEPKKLYKRIERELQGQLSWPPIEQTLHPGPIQTYRGR